MYKLLSLSSGTSYKNRQPLNSYIVILLVISLRKNIHTPNKMKGPVKKVPYTQIHISQFSPNPELLGVI